MVYHSKISETYLIYCDEINSLSLFNNKFLTERNLFLLSPSQNETNYILLTKSKKNKTLEIRQINKENIILKENNKKEKKETIK